MMNSVKPLIVLRPNTDVDKLVDALRSAVSPGCGNVVLLIEVPVSGQTQTSRLFGRWIRRNVDGTPIGKPGQKLLTELARLGLRVRAEVCRDLRPSKILKHAMRFQSDLIITARRPNIAGQFLTYFDEDTSLLTKCPIPVWLCGSSIELEAPIAAAIDPAPQTEASMENNSRVIRTAFALSQKHAPSRTIQFLAICSTDSELMSSSLQRTRVRAMNDLRAEIFRVWSRYFQCTPTDSGMGSSRGIPGMRVQITMQHGVPDKLTMKLDSLLPLVVVLGKPIRSSLSRFFRPGMLPAVVKSSHSMLTVTEQFLKNSAVDEFRRRTFVSPATSSGTRGKTPRPETVC